MGTIFKQEPSTEPPSASQSQCFDPLESFINYDQTIVPTPSISPLSRSKSATTPTSATSNQNFQFPVQATQQTFAGPSHQYEQYRQQAGLPVGALANTFAVNQIDQFSYGRGHPSYMMTPTDGYFGINTRDDFLDFGSAPNQIAAADMDIDFGSPINEMPTLNATFIDPAAIDRQSPPHAHPGRVWPGMHQQQAALAKAQAEEQQRQKQHATMQQQRTVTLPSSHSRQASRSNGNPRPPSDPIVEESISRLLNQMRRSSVASSNDDDAATPNANGSMPHCTRTRKDEEDMDEDERLLASEEGKKLSSKERRQLRNKVSARAFRSRRKEYIGQLEGEIAAKTSEADDLRTKNEELIAENTRLTDLTRMLLSSPAFSTFLNDLSGTGAPASIPEVVRSQSQTPSRPRSTLPRKDISPNQAAPRDVPPHSQNNTHVEMTMIPEEVTLEIINAAETVNNGWTNSVDLGGLYDAQVYALTTVPQGPDIDTINFAMLHDKTSNSVGPYPSDVLKDEPAEIESLPALAKNSQAPDVVKRPTPDADVDVSDPTFALFINRLPTFATPAVGESDDCMFGDIESEKAVGSVELGVNDQNIEGGQVCPATLKKFARLCLRLDEASARIAAVTSHL